MGEGGSQAELNLWGAGYTLNKMLIAELTNRDQHIHTKCIVANSPMAQIYVFVMWAEARENPCGVGRTHKVITELVSLKIYIPYLKSQLKICTNLYFTHLNLKKAANRTSKWQKKKQEWVRNVLKAKIKRKKFKTKMRL